jgi:predicted permease
MTLATLRSFLRAVLGRARMEHEMDSELLFHLDARVEDLVRGGLDRAAAHAQARRELGDPLRWKEQAREARGLRLLDQLGADLRYGLRWLARSPAFAAAAVLSIALGIGVNTAIFSLVNAVLLRLLPVEDPESLVILARSDDKTQLGSSFPYPFYRQLQDSAGALDGVICRAGMSANVEAGGAAERVSGELVSGNYFELLGVRPHMGRLFVSDDNRVPGGHPLVVLSYGYWQRRFGGNPLVIGQTIRVNTHPLTIIGVSPPGFHGVELGASPDIRVPIVMQAEMYASRSRLENPREWWLQIFGRLKHGVRREAAEQELDAGFQRFSATLPSDWPRDRRLILVEGSHGRPTLQNRFARPLLVLSGLAMAVLLLVCLNVANLMLARAAARQRELSVRLAVGASRGRIVAQLLVEALLIATIGGALGVLVAAWSGQALASIAVPAAAGPSLEIAMDLRVLAFATILSVVTGLACGLSPARSVRRTNLVAALSAEARQVPGGRLLGRKLLVVAQIAVSFTLLVGAGLFAQTLANLRKLDFGFETENLLLLSLDPTMTGYAQPQLRVFYDDVAERVASVAGVQSASYAVMRLLVGNSWGSGLTLDTGVHDDNPGPERNAVGAGYFRTIGASIVAGREFTDVDVASGYKVAIVNEAFARRYFGGRALGRRIGPGGTGGSADFTIVGVARDGKYAHVREAVVPFWYVPYQQLPQLGQLTLHVRTARNPETVIADVRQAIAAIDKRVTTFRVTTMRQQISDQLIIERVLAMLAAVFATVAMLLAGIGLYGVMTYTTVARTREIGVRIALGATSSGILRLVFRQTTTLIVIGLSVGLGLALAGVGYVRSLLFGLEPTDPFVLVLAALAIVTVTMVAAWLPARRAIRIDPVAALQ